MADAVTIDIQGDKKLIRKLDRLERRTARSIKRKGLRAGSSVLLKAVRKAAPRDTGNLRKSMTRKFKTYGGRNVIVIVGPAWPKGAHGHLVEFGTKPRATRAGQSTGSMPANPFFEKAIRASLPAVNVAMTRKMKEEIEKEALKGGR